MCDCYMHPCDHPGCEDKIPMHLADFDTGSDEIQVFCERHIPAGAVVYEYSDDEVAMIEDAKNWCKCAIVPLTDNAKANADGNHPNAWWHRVLQNDMLTVSGGRKETNA